MRLPSQFVKTPLYLWVERSIEREECLAQEHNTLTQPGPEPGNLKRESSTLTVRPQ